MHWTVVLSNVGQPIIILESFPSFFPTPKTPRLPDQRMRNLDGDFKPFPKNTGLFRRNRV
jgi:hypothetical protein